MRTGVAYFGHHNPKHLTTDLQEMSRLKLDDVLLAAQENDFVYFPGKLQHTARIAHDLGLRPIAIFWGALNLFGGGRSSQYLLDHPQAMQIGLDGAPLGAGCYVSPGSVGLIKEMIDTIAGLGFQGYFIDEPSPLRDCFCPACRAEFEERHGGDLAAAPSEIQETFRRQCVVDYVQIDGRLLQVETPDAGGHVLHHAMARVPVGAGGGDPQPGQSGDRPVLGERGA